jgi:hypothetical protein
MLHRTVHYGVQEVQPGLWRWNIYPGNRHIQGPAHFRSRELAVAACHYEINDGIERTAAGKIGLMERQAAGAVSLACRDPKPAHPPKRPQFLRTGAVLFHNLPH